MSILYDESQQAIASEARRVADARCDKARLLALLETTGDYDRAFWQTAIEQGWTALAVPEAQGGLGLGLIELGLVAQACGANAAGAPFLAGNAAATALLLAGDDAAARECWLPKLASGEANAAIAFAEGASVLPTRPAVTVSDGALTGTKHGVTAGLAADFALVWAAQDGQPVLALVELTPIDPPPVGEVAARSADGGGAGEQAPSGARFARATSPNGGGLLTRTAIDGFDNSRLHADLTFAATPATLLLTGEAARAAALDALARQAVVLAHEQLGGAEWLMLAARDYALARKAFGQPIGAFQSVKHRIAELYGLVELARANCIDAAAHEGAAREGAPGFLAAAAAARLSASEAYETAARDCVQVHGGIGVTWEHGLHLHMRRARSLAIECGNALFWEDLLVAQLVGAAA